MKRSQKYTIVLLTLIMLLAASGCVERFLGVETDYYTGKPISPEDIDSIFDAISASVTEKYPIETDVDGERIVYWLEGGSVWHSSRACGNIAKADPEKIGSGKIPQAVAGGKERACKICSKDVEYCETIQSSSVNESTEEFPDTTEAFMRDYDSDGNVIVYWFENGSVWHESIFCPTVIRIGSQNAACGNFNDAYVAGKERACKICSPDSDMTFVIQEITTVPAEEETTTLSERYPKEYNSNGELVVFWLANGSVWHESSRCGTILKASPDNVSTGSPYEAYTAGKERACKVCSSDSEIVVDNWESITESVAVETTDQVNQYPKEYDLNGELIVFWLANGSVWHESSRCGTILKASSDKVSTGTPYEAFSAGKERACKVCSKDSKIVIDVHEITSVTTTEEITTATEKYPRDYDINGELIVYWLESGSVWHESIYCSALSDVALNRILSGRVSEAIISLKERACKRCSQ